MRKFIVYYRVSTKKQGESGLGLESQKAYIQHFLKPDQIAGEFTEVASGKYMDCKNRPQLCKAVEACRANGYTLAVAKIDRLSRTTEHALSIYGDLEGRLFACDVPNLDKFTLTIFMAIADRERQLISVRTVQALKAKKRRFSNGEKLGNEQNFTSAGRKKGVQQTIEKSRNNINNMRAMETAVMYREKNYTLQQIADTLNKKGFKTAQNKRFQKTTISRLIKRYNQ
jgi:DNA invertase Pin-like site-specific DNA recombinase